MLRTLPDEADLMLEVPPSPPFDWVREGSSYWLFEENGAFGIPRNGIEAEPHSWDKRRFQANFAFPGGRILIRSGIGDVPAFAAQDPRNIMAGGPIAYRCIEPFKRWLVTFDGMVIDTHVTNQLELSVDQQRLVPLKYEFELEMVGPLNEQDISPEKFFTWAKGKQRDAASVGLGWRFEQMLRGQGEITVDGGTRTARVNGSRIKRRSVRTDGLFLRGHAWQAVVFPDGRAAGYEARPIHEDGHEPWNEAFVYQDGKMHRGRATKVPWLMQLLERGDDVSFEIETELGITRIAGTTELTTFQVAKGHLWGLALSQSGACYSWEGQTAYGMVERSSTSVLNES